MNIIEFYEENRDKNKSLIIFFQSQINLFSSLCQNRYFSCNKYFREIFPLTTLMKYSLNNYLEDDLRAIFCKLISNLYIDKEPRNMKIHPKLVRLFNFNKKHLNNISHQLSPTVKKDVLKAEKSRIKNYENSKGYIKI